MVSRIKNKLEVYCSVPGYRFFLKPKFHKLWNYGIMEFVYGIMKL